MQRDQALTRPDDSRMIEPRFRRDPAEMWWIEHAGCIGEDPELFFPIGTSAAAMEQTARAIAVCSGCPVRSDCLEWSLDTCQDAGVWGGMGEEERREIRRARRRAAVAVAAIPSEPLTAGNALAAVG